MAPVVHRTQGRVHEAVRRPAEGGLQPRAHRRRDREARAPSRSRSTRRSSTFIDVVVDRVQLRGERHEPHCRGGGAGHEAGRRARARAGAGRGRAAARRGRRQVERRHGRPRRRRAYLLARACLPRARPFHGRAAAARLLVQRPLRCLPGLPRHRQPRGGGSLARWCPTPRLTLAEGAIGGLFARRATTTRRLLRAVAKHDGHRRKHAVGGHAEEGPPTRLLSTAWATTKVRVDYVTGGRARDVLVHRVGRGARCAGAAPLPGGPVRQPAREAVGVLSPSCRAQTCGGKRLKPGDPGRDGGRQVHPRSVSPG